MLGALKLRLADNGITAEFDDAAISKIAKVGFDPVYGARPLRRAIQSEIEDMIAEQMLEQKIKPGDHITVTVSDDKFTCVPTAAAVTE